MSKANDNEAFTKEVQARLKQRGETLDDDGWGGTDSLAALDRHFPSLKITPAVVLPVVKIPATAPAPEPGMPAVGFSKRTLENLEGLNKKARAKLQVFLVAAQLAMVKHGVTIEVISGLRSWAQQAALYAQGRTKAGKIVTKARPGSSWHNYGLAFDLGLFRGGKYLDEAEPRLAATLYAELGRIAAEMGVEWAGTWKDFAEGPHFQVTFGLTLSQARAQMETNGQDCQKLVFP